MLGGGGALGACEAGMLRALVDAGVKPDVVVGPPSGRSTAASSPPSTGSARGRPVDPILASSAVPGVLPAVRIGEEHFIDGGVVNSIPVSRAAREGGRGAPS